MPQLYALAIAAEQDFPSRGVERLHKVTAGWLYADSDQAAHKLARILAENYFPSTEGWYGHITDVQPFIHPSEKGTPPMAKKLTPDELPAEEPIDNPVVPLGNIVIAPLVTPPAPEPQPPIGPGITIGQIVHYVLTLGYAAGGSHRAAIITNVLDPAGLIELMWFPHIHDQADLRSITPVPVALVDFNPAGTPGTWHWPEQV